MRNRLIILLIVVVGIVTDAKAQIAGSTLIGIKGGYTMSSLYGANVGDSLSTGGSVSSKSGFNIGVGGYSMLGKYFWLKHDLLLTKKGAVLTLDDQNKNPYKSNLNLLYLDLFPCSPTFQYKGFQLFAGPYLGMLVNANIQHKNSAGNLYKDNNIFGNPGLLKDYTQRIDLGFVAGLEYEFSCGFNVGIRYVQGFVPLIENPLIQKGQAQIYNKNINISVGYTFGREKGLKLGKKTDPASLPPGY